MEKKDMNIEKGGYCCLGGYIFNNFKNEPITPNLPTIISILNQQYARIKKLEKMNYRLSQGLYWGNGEQFCDVVKKLKQENQQLKQQLGEKDKVIEMQKSIKRNDIGETLTENIKLRQSQNKKAIEVLEKVRNYFVEECKDGDEIETGDLVITKDIIQVACFVDNQIKELKGG